MRKVPSYWHRAKEGISRHIFAGVDVSSHAKHIFDVCFNFGWVWRFRIYCISLLFSFDECDDERDV